MKFQNSSFNLVFLLLATVQVSSLSIGNKAISNSEGPNAFQNPTTFPDDANQLPKTRPPKQRQSLDDDDTPSGLENDPLIQAMEENMAKEGSGIAVLVIDDAEVLPDEPTAIVPKGKNGVSSRDEPKKEGSGIPVDLSAYEDDYEPSNWMQGKKHGVTRDSYAL